MSCTPVVRIILCCTVALSALAGARHTAAVADDQPSASLAAKLMPLIASHDGQVAVSVRHLDSGESFHHRHEAVMPTASLIKFPVMIEAYRQAHAGRLDPESKITLSKGDTVPGSGVLTEHFSIGLSLSVRDAIQLMIAFSDNTATNLVLDRIGLESTAATMTELGFPETRIHSKVYRGDTSIDPERSNTYGLGSTRSADMVELFERLYRNQLVSPEACEAMLAHLFACRSRTGLPRLLPEDVRVAHKTGAVSASRCDAGILFTSNGPIAVCVLTTDNKDQSWNDDNAANLLCARIARTAYDHFNPPWKTGTSDDRGLLQMGAFGEMVEALQRTLNARLEPSPDLSIDGDFGPMTQSAVIGFQRSHHLEPTGVVGPKTWDALSPLLIESTPVPKPDVVNAEVLPVETIDELDGVPIVSCKAWGVADAKSGTLIAGSSADRRLGFASTTKIMTAHLVLQLASRDPDVLEETIVFSRRADRTRGSTAGIREGERLPVREVLYGLLLPSGNDASVALAEHFGYRLADANDKENGADPLECFVDAMNREADRIGMANTSYRNPHGLTAPEHRSCVRDLLRLAAEAMANPVFRRYVATRQRGCTVTGTGGYRRNVVWKNTNRLLPIEGYHGVKTGTTGEAGACLVSHSRRGNEELLLVVLGSTSSAGRYVDSRNLFRWAWNQRLEQ